MPVTGPWIPAFAGMTGWGGRRSTTAWKKWASRDDGLEEHVGAHHDVLAAARGGGRGRVDAGGVERPARHRAVGHRVVALQHRDLGRGLLREPVPLVVGPVGEARGLADPIVVDPVVGDVGLV